MSREAKPVGKEKKRPVGFQYMALDILENLLSNADDLSAMGADLTQQIRELTGARSVILLQCLHNFGESGHRLVFVNPERRRKQAESVVASPLPEVVHDLEESEVWGLNADTGEAENILADFQCGLSIAVPLNVGTFKVGALLLLDLPDPQHISMVVEILNLLSTMVALVFRNYILYEKQESIIEKRTRELKESELRLQTAQRLAKVGSWALNRDTGEMYWSDETYRLFGYEPGEVTPSFKLFLKHVHPGDKRQVKKGMKKAYKKQEIYTAEFRLTARGGIERIIHAITEEEPGEAGEKLVRYGAFQDITDRKRAEEEKEKMETQLRQSQKMEAIGTLAGGIAHDFNNILSAIIGYTELAICDIPAGSLARQNLDQVLHASSRVKDLVKQILSFSRFTEQERLPLRLGKITREALKLLKASIPATIEIRHNIKTVPGTVLADPTQVHQVLMNLCTNAAHAMQQSGGVMEINLDQVDIDNVSADQDGELKPGPYCRLTVSDSGHGIDSKTRDRIFEPFFTTKEPGQGTGMGLSVVHGIVMSHGGTIKVSSTPGKGTTFHIYLPLIKSEMEVQDKTDNKFLPTGTEHILFVDDKEILVDIVTQMLERLGYRVSTRTSSLEALELFQAMPGEFDLVITDMTMPRMTGTRLSQSMLKIRPDIPIILCTGFSKQITREKAKAIGIKRFLMKPLLAHQMARVIREVLDGISRETVTTK